MMKFISLLRGVIIKKMKNAVGCTLLLDQTIHQFHLPRYAYAIATEI